MPYSRARVNSRYPSSTVSCSFSRGRRSRSLITCLTESFCVLVIFTNSIGSACCFTVICHPIKIARRNRKIQPYPNEYSRIAPTIINVAIPRRSQTSPPLGVSRFRTPIRSSSKVSRIDSGPRAAMITLPNTGPTIA